MKPLHYVLLGFAAVVVGKIVRGLVSGWLGVSI